MKKLVIACVLAALSPVSVAMAGAKCEAHPKAEWMKEADLRNRLEGQGYKIKVFKVDGDCYEIYGHNKEGKKVEIYFDTVSGEPVKTRVR